MPVHVTLYYSSPNNAKEIQRLMSCNDCLAMIEHDNQILAHKLMISPLNTRWLAIVLQTKSYWVQQAIIS